MVFAPRQIRCVQQSAGGLPEEGRSPDSSQLPTGELRRGGESLRAANH